MSDKIASEREAGPGTVIANEAQPERGFTAGELVVLRPVKEADLSVLARLLAENPYDREPEPWTLQRLKQKFEDKDKPGLWDDQKGRYFTIARRSGGVVGYLYEEFEWAHRGILWNRFYLGQDLPDRDALGRDALQAYFAYKQRWHDPLRIAFSIASVQPQEAQWLADAGYELELTLPDAVLYRGEPASELLYSWISPQLLARLSDDGPVAGEDDSAETVSAGGGIRQRPEVKE